MKMILKNTLFYAAAAMFFLSSCNATKRASKQDKGVAIGATGGAVIGGILGNNIGKGGHTALGAIIGAAVGGLAGGIIGNNMDKQAEKIKTEIPGAKVEHLMKITRMVQKPGYILPLINLILHLTLNLL
jgi:phage tail tape-measure protein